ncbi:hypothetical protein FDECE_10867 [Fusarium decemcellulare]|nr:hypothetical protein FDECE_10867 [Fusarium decemcellulare]
MFLPPTAMIGEITPQRRLFLVIGHGQQNNETPPLSIMPPSKDEGGIPPSFDLNAEIPNPDTTGTITEDTPGPVSFLDNLDVSMLDVSSIDFSEVLDAPWLSEHASIDNRVPVADNFPWPGGIPVSETHRPDLHVEDGPSQEELSSLWLAFPPPAEGEFAALEAPGPGPMDLDLASDVPLFPNESSLGEPSLGEVQPRFNQQDVLRGPEPGLGQQLGLQLSEAAKMPDARTDCHQPQRHDIPSGRLWFQEPCDNTYNAHGTSAAVNSGSSVHASDVLGPNPSATTSYWPPMFPQQRPLVPRKRGGRHGRLTEDQLKRQRTARLTGVCIRCKYLNKSCHGGFPCEACQTMRKPRLFRGPCTKAQFLEIIQAGSFFLRTSLYESMILEYLDEEKALGMRTQFAFLKVHSEPFIVYALGKECKVPYALGGELLQLLFFASPGRPFQKLSNSKIANPWRFLAIDELHGDCIVFPYGFKGSQRVYWTLLASSFCSGRTSPGFFEAPNKVLMWLSCRYGELFLFNHLQETSNQLAQKSTPDLNLVYCIFIILRISMVNDKLENSLRTCDDAYERTILEEYVDRRKRIRTALWIYASIVISKIQSWTNFWENLPWSVDIFREPKVLERFADGLDNFDVEGYKASKSAFDSKNAVFQRLSISDGIHPHEQHTDDENFIEDVWTRILTNTPEGVEQLRHVLSDTPGDSTDRVTQYELDEAERFFLPKTKKDQRLAVRQVFGMLISLRNVPIDRDDISEHAEFIWLLMVIQQFQLRLGPKEYENCASTSQSSVRSAAAQHHAHLPIPSWHGFMHSSKSIKAVKRWKELTHILGDGILLSRSMDQDTHCFLDIATMVEHGNDAAFSRLKSLLRLKGSWLKAICGKLNGLVQAVRELPYPTLDLGTARDFCVKVYGATSEAFGQGLLPEAVSSSHKAFIAFHLISIRDDFMPDRSEVSERHKMTWDILTDSINQTGTEFLQEKFTLGHNLTDPIDKMIEVLGIVTERFTARYVATLGGNSTDREDAAVDMANRISSAMVSGFVAVERNQGFPIEQLPLPDLPEDFCAFCSFKSIFEC